MKRRLNKDLGFRRHEVIAKWPFPTFANHIQRGARSLTSIPAVA